MQLGTVGYMVQDQRRCLFIKELYVYMAFTVLCRILISILFEKFEQGIATLGIEFSTDMDKLIV